MNKAPLSELPDTEPEAVPSTEEELFNQILNDERI